MKPSLFRRSSMSKRPITVKSYSAGFTLVEVMVALLVVGIALTIATQAATSIAQSMYELRQRSYAGWSAQNRVNELQMQRVWPVLGTRQFPCPQGDYDFLCEEEVTATANPYFRRIEVRVYAKTADGKSTGNALTALIAYLDNRS